MREETIAIQVPFILREATPEDHNFIYNSWLTSYHTHSDCKWCPDAIYYKGQADIITYLLDTAKVIVACWPEDPEEIMAYIVYEYGFESLVVHWIYCKNLQRKKGRATEIIATLASRVSLVVATHITDSFTILRHKVKDKRVIFDPFYISNKRNNGL